MGQLFTDADIELESPATIALPEEERYRRTTPFAIACLIVGVLALFCLAAVQDLGALAYMTIPAVGLVLGVRAFMAIKRYDEQGKMPNRIGLALCVLCLATAWPLQKYLDANEIPPGYQRIGYEKLQAEEGKGPIPDSAKALDGQRVFIKGFVYPGKKTSGITEFVLCRDNGSCCFGGQPKLNDMIQVKLKEPLSLDYDTNMRQLAGTFRVSTKSASDGLGQVLYELEADYLK